MMLPLWLLIVPLLYAVTALVPSHFVVGSERRWWSVAQAVAAAQPLIAIGAAAALVWRGAWIGARTTPVLQTRLDATTVIMLLLVTSIAALILRFSRRYLAGEPGQLRYIRWFMATMAAASLLVVTNNLLVLGLAWLASSLAMHQLLTFYDERPQALIAAHKKFLLGRLADVAIFAAIAGVFAHYLRFGRKLSFEESDQVEGAVVDSRPSGKEEPRRTMP
jgi:NAD(P)H-quinone oxidoreductase subunit 5